MTDESITQETASIEKNDKPTNRLLTDETFNRLRDAQREISDATGVVPTLRKMINLLVTQDAVNKLTKQTIEKLNTI